MTRWLGFCNVKGGAGKSTTAFACAIAAAQLGRRAVVVDLDPSGWLSAALGVLHHPITVADVLTGKAKVEEAVTVSDLGVAVLVGGRALYHVGLSYEAMQGLRQQVDPLFEVVLADSHPGENMIPALMRVCDRICIPLPLDRVSAIVSTDTLVIADEAGALDRIGGLLPAIVKLRQGEPEDTEGREVYSNMTMLGISYETIFVTSKHWSRATTLAEPPPSRLINGIAVPLFSEVLERRADPDRLRIWMHAYSRARRAQEQKAAQEANT